MRDPQGKSKILHSRSYAYFPGITSHRNPPFQLRWCLPVWTCLLECHLYLPLSFSGSLLLSHPPQDSLPPLYMYLSFSIIYSFYYIYKEGVVSCCFKKNRPPAGDRFSPILLSIVYLTFRSLALLQGVVRCES